MFGMFVDFDGFESSLVQGISRARQRGFQKLDPNRNGVSCQFYDAELEILVGLLQQKSNSVRS
jgi:hypothetical protein